jgi:DNA-binding response OmpR family regulator
MEVRPLSPKQSVLIVDPLDESREVLRTALERRGMHIFEARRGSEGLDIAREYHPDLVVLDVEIEEESPQELSRGFRAASPMAPPAMIMLGSIRRQVPAGEPGEFVSKPYHYGPLIRKIESLLTEAPLRAA